MTFAWWSKSVQIEAKNAQNAQSNFRKSKQNKHAHSQFASAKWQKYERPLFIDHKSIINKMINWNCTQKVLYYSFIPWYFVCCFFIRFFLFVFCREFMRIANANKFYSYRNWEKAIKIKMKNNNKMTIETRRQIFCVSK